MTFTNIIQFVRTQPITEEQHKKLARAIEFNRSNILPDEERERLINIRNQIWRNESRLTTKERSRLNNLRQRGRSVLLRRLNHDVAA